MLMLWFTVLVVDISYFPSMSPVRNWMMAVLLKTGTTALVELLWKQEAEAVAEKTRSVRQQHSCIFSITPLCGFFFKCAACQNWIPKTKRNKICNLLFPLTNNASPRTRSLKREAKWKQMRERKENKQSDIFTNTAQFSFCTPRTCQHCQDFADG